jgi:hypothetical protein
LGESFPLVPRTSFYDWLYLHALIQNEHLLPELEEYNAFSDIAFNPEKSLNCQARSAALYLGLKQARLIRDCLESRERYFSIVGTEHPPAQAAWTQHSFKY